MKNLLLIASMLLTTAYAQDFIILKTGEEIKAKVKEIDLDVIKYLNFDNQNGPTYTIEKSKVFLIKYENGTKDIINAVENTAPAAVAPKQAKPESVVKQKEVKVKPTINRDYLQDAEYRKKRSSGIALTTVGCLLGGVGGPTLLGLAASDFVFVTYESSNSYYADQTFGITGMAVGAAAIAGGVAMIAVGSIQIEKAKAIKYRYQSGKVYMNFQPGVTGSKFTLHF